MKGQYIAAFIRGLVPGFIRDIAKFMRVAYQRCSMKLPDAKRRRRFRCTTARGHTLPTNFTVMSS